MVWRAGNSEDMSKYTQSSDIMSFWRAYFRTFTHGCWEGDGEVAHNILEMLETSVNAFKDRPAVWDPQADGTFIAMSYAQLWEDIRRVSGKLREEGVQYDSKVGLLALSRSWWPIVDVAVMSLGAVTVPIYPSLPSNQMEFIIRHSDMEGLVLQDMKQLKKVLDIPATSIPGLRFLVVLDESRDPQLLHAARKRFQVYFYEDWIRARHTLSEEEWKGFWAGLTRDDVATIVFTSGTTGVPKGVVLTHGNILANIEGIREIVRLYPTDRSLSYLPLSHIFERTCGQFVPFAAGASIAYARNFQQILDDFRVIPPTIFTTVPRLLEKIQEGVYEKVQQSGKVTQRLFQWAVDLGTKVRVEKSARAGARLALADRLVFHKIQALFGGQLRAVIVGGAPLPRYVGRFFTAVGMSVAEGYGMTETSPVVAANRPEAPVLGTAGRILHNVQVRIADDGEVLVKGPSIMRGYYHNEEATREAFTEDGWLRTGDIGRVTPTGELQITDRKKNLIVLSTGKKVTPAPIEGDILKRPVVDQVVLIGQGRKYISAIVVPNEPLVADWYRRRGKDVPPRSEWHKDVALVNFLLREVEEATREYAKFEQPKKILIAREPFTVDNGLMTPTLKARAKAVVEAYQAEIDALYEESRASASSPA
jgi:long-chain acyl-CoA synthetase